MIHRLIALLVSAATWPARAIGSAAHRLDLRVDEWARVRTSLRPGTRVLMNCACHGKMGVWFVERYDAEADDYHLVRKWPPGEHRAGEECCFAARSVVTVVTEEGS